MPKKKKKKWTTPQLIELMKGEPGERVLLSCKRGSASGFVGSSFGACYLQDWFPSGWVCNRPCSDSPMS